MICKYPTAPPTPALVRFRAEFSDVRSLADVALLSPDRLARFRHEFSQIGDLKQ
jgi:hypothetical protein